MVRAEKIEKTADPVRWGILGTGDIARQFASDLNLLEQARLAAVGSRSQAGADLFGDAHAVPRRHPSYEALVEDPEVELVYIATPHHRHLKDALLCLERGKSVVCEKPIALNRAQAERMVATARSRKLFLMEAMWTLFFPAIREAFDALEQGAIGEPTLMRADFCFRIDFDPNFRLFNPLLGGGALLDVGVYPVALAHEVFKEEPTEIASTVHLCETGVDERAAMILGFSGGRMASLACSSRSDLPHEAFISGTEGWLRLPRFSQPDSYTIGNRNREETRRFDRIGFGYAFEAVEAMRAFRGGELECSIAPLDSSVAVMKTLDRIRSDWGLNYPGEENLPPNE